MAEHTECPRVEARCSSMPLLCPCNKVRCLLRVHAMSLVGSRKEKALLLRGLGQGGPGRCVLAGHDAPGPACSASPPSDGRPATPQPAGGTRWPPCYTASAPPAISAPPWAPRPAPRRRRPGRPASPEADRCPRATKPNLFSKPRKECSTRSAPRRRPDFVARGRRDAVGRPGSTAPTPRPAPPPRT